jgi:hypothetical protein
MATSDLLLGLFVRFPDFTHETEASSTLKRDRELSIRARLIAINSDSRWRENMFSGYAVRANREISKENIHCKIFVISPLMLCSI